MSCSLFGSPCHRERYILRDHSIHPKGLGMAGLLSPLIPVGIHQGGGVLLCTSSRGEVYFQLHYMTSHSSLTRKQLVRKMVYFNVDPCSFTVITKTLPEITGTCFVFSMNKQFSIECLCFKTVLTRFPGGPVLSN